MLEKKLTKYLLFSTFLLAALSIILKDYGIGALLFLFFQCSLIGLIFMLVGKKYNQQ